MLQFHWYLMCVRQLNQFYSQIKLKEYLRRTSSDKTFGENYLRIDKKKKELKF
ncbi:hypothetical protein LCGC14_0875280 [marine sediment metagenome]|uniref:Uncharacterized protein n=1 Tax=marine sediment metagenome TaxID=412755 RepID=A0A0F9PP66_9ZZZZ